MNRTEAEVGFYGKLPFKGDFLQRRVPQEFVDPWDAWLQQGLHESRLLLQDAWLEAYLSGPVWRFVLAEGVCGAAGYAGILVPSVDRVGRYFPLTLVTRLEARICPVDVACDSGGWFDAAEAVALAALAATEMDIDEFDDQVAGLGRYLPALSVGSAVLAAPGSDAAALPPEGWQVPLEGTVSLQRAVNAFAYAQLDRALRPAALWWSDGSNAVDPCWVATSGLPDARRFTAMWSAKTPESGHE
jgi:type VI secretion system protein ImpM